jgi:hypothetical protein
MIVRQVVRNAEQLPLRTAQHLVIRKLRASGTQSQVCQKVTTVQSLLIRRRRREYLAQGEGIAVLGAVVGESPWQWVSKAMIASLGAPTK